ncbi:MAG: hypothetical protein UY18_C0012G0032 [Microgenomates group bacterium GW2011_GWF2_47_9]|nr:MAG: hypothetical protein UY18_C0012G0032 [Microgenomates group bacterium GW2011_GWF2_47_9]
MGAVKKALLFFLGLRLLAVPGWFFLYERFAPLDFIAPIFKDNFLFWSFANFDGEHYLSIAKFGYQVRNGFPQYAFFPLYPLMIKMFSFVVRDYLLAGLAISFISLAAILYFVPKKLHLPILLAPGAVFLTAVYTEPLFLALAAATFYYANRKDWTKSVIFTALATATRVNGIFLAAFLLATLWQNRVSLKKILGYAIVSISGLVSYMLYLFITTGSALSWYHAQAYWGKAEATSPLTTAESYFRAVTFEFKPDLVHLVVVFEVAITLWAIFLTLTVIRKRLLSPPYYLYLLGNLAMPILTGSLGSMPRFFLILFPSYIAINTFSPNWRKLVYTVSSSIMIIGVILFTRGHWFA